jgi:hypothetical protein
VTETTPRPLPVSPAEARALLAAERTGGTVVVSVPISPQPVLTTIQQDAPQGQSGEFFRKGWRWKGEWLADLGEEEFIALCPYAVGDVLDVGGGLVATVRAVTVARDDGGRWCWAVEVGARKGRVTA